MPGTSNELISLSVPCAETHSAAPEAQLTICSLFPLETNSKVTKCVLFVSDYQVLPR